MRHNVAFSWVVLVQVTLSQLRLSKLSYLLRTCTECRACEIGVCKTTRRSDSFDCRVETCSIGPSSPLQSGSGQAGQLGWQGHARVTDGAVGRASVAAREILRFDLPCERVAHRARLGFAQPRVGD